MYLIPADNLLCCAYRQNDIIHVISFYEKNSEEKKEVIYNTTCLVLDNVVYAIAYTDECKNVYERVVSIYLSYNDD